VPPIRFTTISLMPQFFLPQQEEGVFARGMEKNLFTMEHVLLRSFGLGERKHVDHPPVGEADGMVLSPVVCWNALQSCYTPQSQVLIMSPSGKRWDSTAAKKMIQHSHIILICGRYAGFDERFIEKSQATEISVGDYVLSGGELAAMICMDSMVRFIPGVLGNSQSSQTDSFEDGLLEAPQYTKPLQWEGLVVPEILTSGNHKEISKFKRKQQIQKTIRQRPDLILEKWEELSSSEKQLAKKWGHQFD
jgi:tRNA (guanine37-N1)-methyltransferase